MADLSNENKATPSGSHELRLLNRKNLYMNGIDDVISFDDKTIELKTVCGELIIDGNELRITVLDTVKGAVNIEGTVHSLNYYDPKTNDKSGRFGKQRR